MGLILNEYSPNASNTCITVHAHEWDNMAHLIAAGEAICVYFNKPPQTDNGTEVGHHSALVPRSYKMHAPLSWPLGFADLRRPGACSACMDMGLLTGLLRPILATDAF